MAKAPDPPNVPKGKQRPARDPAKHSKKDPARPTRAKASRPDAAADRPRARGPAQSRHRPGHRGAGLADRAQAAGGQFVRPPRRFLRRPPRAQIHRAGVRRGAAARLRRQGRRSAAARSRSGARRWVSKATRTRAPRPRRRRAATDRRGRLRARELPRHHRRVRHGAGAGDAAARRPPGIRRAAVDAAPAAAAGKIRGRPAPGDQVGLRAQGRPAAGDRRAGRGRRAATTAPRCCSASPARARPSPWPR